MALRFLADHCVGNLVIQSLRNAGHEVIRLRDVIRPETSDLIVIAKTQELEAILLSLNGDFADIVTYPPKEYRGIVALQIRNHPEALPHVMVRLLSYIESHSEAAHYEGKLLVIEVDRIRVRD